MAGPALNRAGPFLICFYGGYDGNTSVGDTAAKTVGYAAVGCENREFSGIFGRITCRSGYALSADVEYILRLVRSILCFFCRLEIPDTDFSVAFIRRTIPSCGGD